MSDPRARGRSVFWDVQRELQALDAMNAAHFTAWAIASAPRSALNRVDAVSEEELRAYDAYTAHLRGCEGECATEEGICDEGQRLKARWLEAK